MSAESAYGEALTALFSARRLGIDFGLERMRSCLESLGLCEGGPRVTIQIAGTNGKGSTAQLLASVLGRAGLSVGVFSSPHLLSLRERFRINGIAASRGDFVRAHDAVARHAAGMTFFEQVTGIAAWLFADADVDVAIYEVGLGGRLDSTTAIPADLSVVTGIGIDHCEFLGHKLDEIAAEKAGIFRDGVPAVIGLSAPPRIRARLVELARHAGARPTRVGGDHIARVPETLAMLGAHQKQNAATALAVVMELRKHGLAITEAALTEGLSAATLPGRLEEIEAGLWVDGAHNAQAAQVLADTLVDKGPWVLVVGLSQSKDALAFLEPLAGICCALVATEARSERAMPSGRVASRARAAGIARVSAEPCAASALRQARTLAGGAPVLVTGSLLLLGDVLAGMGRGPVDPVGVTDPGGRKVATDDGPEYP